MREALTALAFEENGNEMEDQWDEVHSVRPEVDAAGLGVERPVVIVVAHNDDDGGAGCEGEVILNHASITNQRPRGVCVTYCCLRMFEWRWCARE